MAAIADGNEAALRHVYDETRGRLLGLAQRLLGERSAAEEVLVDVYAQVWRSARSYDPARGAVELWLLTITRSRAIDRLRSNGTRRNRLTLIEEIDELTSERPSPMQQSESRESSSRVRVALQELPLEQRVAIEAAFFGGLSHSEVARALDSPLGTVKSRIRAGLITLRRTLASEHQG